MKIVTAAQMQALDRRTITEAGISGLTLMRAAGAGVVRTMEGCVAPLAGTAVAILCGKGNNGGDGFVVGHLLRRRRARVRILLMAAPKDLTGDGKAMYRQYIRAAGSSSVVALPSRDHIRAVLNDSDLIVDALLGTGLTTAVSGVYADAVDSINELAGARGRPVIAVDLPSGLHADTGEVLGTAVRASLTVTFGLPKLGLYLRQGIDHAGRIEFVDIGIPPEFVDGLDTRLSLITSDQVRTRIPRRRASAHKGTFGHAGIIAGSMGKTGAAAMVARAALRAGAGLVTVATPLSANPILEAKLLEAMTIPMPETDTYSLASAGLERLLAFAYDRTAIALGPGLTTDPDTVALVRRLIEHIEAPLVIDADGLNALGAHPDFHIAGKLPPILTPHPGEMARLTGTSASAVNADRVETATAFAQTHRVIVVLKGARTVVAGPDGSVAICPTGNPGMATAGTGDALTGILVGLLAQGLSPWDAACAGTYLHGLAGDIAATDIGQAGMMAGDLIERIPYALQRTLPA